MVVEPFQFCNRKDFVSTNELNRRLAKNAWREIKLQFPEGAATADYVDGFYDGFADFLNYGGNGLPPVLPPRRYWQAKQRLAANRLAAQKWLDGFAHGAAVARQSGLREAGTVPISLCLIPAASPIANAPLHNRAVSEVRRLPPVNTESLDGESMRAVFEQSNRMSAVTHPRIDANR